MTENPYESPQVAAEFRGDPVDSLSRTRALVLCVVLGAIGLGIGAASRLARPQFQGSVHYEALVELVIKIALGLVLVPVCRFLGGSRPVSAYWMSSVSLWGGALVGWSLINKRVWEDYVFVNLLWMFVVASVGTILILIWRKLASRGG